MRYLFILLFLISFAVSSPSSQRQKQTDRAKPNPGSLAVRQDALSAANEVVDQVSEVEDLRSRVALAEKLVRLLAKSLSDRLRKMLNTIFDDAITSKTDSAKSKAVPPDLESLIGRIIQAAAIIDLELAHDYIGVLSNLRDVDGSAQKSSSTSILYLKIATQIVRSNPSLAVDIAMRSLANGILPETLVFLASLRKIDVTAANRFFAAALQTCQTRGGKDINELLLLYSYVFSPLSVPTVVSHGIGVLNIPGYSQVAKNYGVDTGLAGQYLAVLSDILLNPHRYSAMNVETLALGIEGDFYAFTVMEPWIATYDPTNSAAISAQRNTLLAYMEASQREAAFSAADLWKKSPRDLSFSSGAKETTVEYLVDKAETTADPKRKDQLYFRAALLAARLKKYETAVAVVERMSPDYSDKAKKFVRFDIAVQYVQNQQWSEAEKLARMDDVLARRAYVFTLIADSLTQEQARDPSRALQYLEEVQQLAGKLSEENEKLSVLIGAGYVYARLDTVRASEILREIVKQANKVPKFVGDSTIANVLEIGGFYFDYSIYSSGLTIFDFIKRIAEASYYATLQDIRLLKNRTLRLLAITALCSAVIEEGN